ncbi:MAG: DNA mismatch repair protein MutS [Clostridiaceae bacterium]|nr:DNA mismatch repair protein MutS [Clostridiaceae bacterium]
MFEQISLLFCDNKRKLLMNDQPPSWIKDLKLDSLLDIMCAGSPNPACRRIMTAVLSELNNDPETIDYRYDILQDFCREPVLLETLRQVLARLETIERDRQSAARMRNRVTAEYKLAKEISIFMEYGEIYKKLASALSAHQKACRSKGLKNLAASIHNDLAQADFRELTQMLFNLKQCLKGYLRIKLQVRMDTSFKLTDARILDIDSNGFGADCLGKEAYSGHSLAQEVKNLLQGGKGKDDAYPVKQIDYLLEQNVQEVKDKALLSIAAILEVLSARNSAYLRKLADELVYYEGAGKLAAVMQQCDLVSAHAVIVPSAKRCLQANGLYDLSFALYLYKTGQNRPMELIVSNDVAFNETGRIQIISGPNQGGKTTYLRAIGILQVLAQAGLPIPAAQADISPADQIFTHFPVDEMPESHEGRLGEELDRMLAILKQATPDSLILMNESFASTNAREGSQIAENVLSAIALIGTRCAFVTHLYEFAGKVDFINQTVQARQAGAARLISMAAQYEDARPESDRTQDGPVRLRTYRILPGPPAKSSFAADIARQFGIRR